MSLVLALHFFFFYGLVTMYCCLVVLRYTPSIGLKLFTLLPVCLVWFYGCWKGTSATESISILMRTILEARSESIMIENRSMKHFNSHRSGLFAHTSTYVCSYDTLGEEISMIDTFVDTEGSNSFIRSTSITHQRIRKNLRGIIEDYLLSSINWKNRCNMMFATQSPPACTFS